MFECPHLCGRTFPTQEKLEEHIQRRHILNQTKMMPSLYDNLKQKRLLRQKLIPFQSSNTQTQSSSSQAVDNPPQSLAPIKQSEGSQVTKLKMIPKKTILRPSSSKDSRQITNTKVEKQVKIELPEPQYSSAEILASKELITRRLLLQNTGCGQLNEVSHIVLNNQNLLVFESSANVDFSDLEQLKTLSLFQNKLINVIGLSQLWNLIDLNIANNQIQSLQPLSSLRLIQNLYASNNMIQELEMGMMVHMKLFHIGNNHLNSFDSVLKQLKMMPSLKDLELVNNPCTVKYAYKYDVLWTCFIDKLDHVQITQQDYNLAKTFQDNQRVNNTMSQSTIIRPGTAPNNDYEEIDQNQLEEEIEELYDINLSLREKVDKLEKQNLELRATAERVEFLQEQLQNSLHTISAYETMLILKDSPNSELQQQIFSLTLQLQQLKQQNINLQNEDSKNDAKTDLVFQNTSATNQYQSFLLNNQNEVQSDDDEKYFNDDDNIVDQQSQEIMDLIMRNSIGLAQIKSEFKQI